MKNGRGMRRTGLTEAFLRVVILPASASFLWRRLGGLGCTWYTFVSLCLETTAFAGNDNICFALCGPALLLLFENWGLTKGNKLDNMWARGRKKRRGTLERALPKNKKTALYVGAAAVACGCRRTCFFRILREMEIRRRYTIRQPAVNQWYTNG